MARITAILTSPQTPTILLTLFHKFSVVFLNLHKLIVAFGDSGILYSFAVNSQEICRRIKSFVLCLSHKNINVLLDIFLQWRKN